MMKLWSCLEELPGLRAVPAMWRGGLGDEFDLVRAAFLRTTGRTAASFPCPRECGCTHRIVSREDGSLVAVCECESWNCDDIPLAREEIGVLELNWTKLARALAKAFDFDPNIVQTDCVGVWQSGRVRGTATPVLLCVQHEPREFTRAITDLAADLRKPFVLLAPTSRFMDVRTHTLLTSIGAEFVDLGAHVRVQPDGTLAASADGRELLSPKTRHKQEAAHKTGRVLANGENPERPRYALRKGLRTWELVFRGVAAPIADGRGVQIAAYLLRNPPVERIHALKLERLVWADRFVDEQATPCSREQETDMAANLSIRSEADGVARCQDDNAILKREVRELLEIIRDGTLPKEERDEAQERLDAISQSLSGRGELASDASKAAERMRKAINRLHEQLAGARDEKKEPHPVLREFAEHLRKYLVVPSARFTKSRNSRNKAGVAGTFTYEPPADVVWEK